MKKYLLASLLLTSAISVGVSPSVEAGGVKCFLGLPCPSLGRGVYKESGRPDPNDLTTIEHHHDVCSDTEGLTFFDGSWFPLYSSPNEITSIQYNDSGCGGFPGDPDTISVFGICGQRTCHWGTSAVSQFQRFRRATFVVNGVNKTVSLSHGYNGNMLVTITGAVYTDQYYFVRQQAIQGISGS